MDHAQRTQGAQVLPHKDDLLKGFLVLLLVDGVLSLIMAGVDWSYEGLAPSTPFSLVVNIVAFAVFVMSIVVWVRSVKRKYPKYILWTAITRVLLPVLLGILVFVAGIVFVMNSVDTTSVSADPSMIPEEITNKLKWLSLLPAISGLVYAGLAVNALIKLRKAWTG